MLLNCDAGEGLLSLLDFREIKPVHPKGNQLWISIGRTDTEAEAPILWPPDIKNWLIGKDPGAGKDWGQKEKGATEDEMVGWHHWLNGHEFEWTQGDSEGQRSLVCYSSWGHKELDMIGDWTKTRGTTSAMIPFPRWITSWDRGLELQNTSLGQGDTLLSVTPLLKVWFIKSEVTTSRLYL